MVMQSFQANPLSLAVPEESFRQWLGSAQTAQTAQSAMLRRSRSGRGQFKCVRMRSSPTINLIPLFWTGSVIESAKSAPEWT